MNRPQMCVRCLIPDRPVERYVYVRQELPSGISLACCCQLH